MLSKSLRRLSSSPGTGALAGSAARSVSSLVTAEIRGNVGVLTLTDPARLNALTAAMGQQFVAAVDEMNEAVASQKIRACVVTGAGDAFSAGGDIDWLRERHTSSSPMANRATMIQFYNLFLHIRKLRVPTIAAINGHAIGAGMCMTLACDFRIAADNAKIGFTFAKLGIHPGMGASLLLPRVISEQRANYYLLTGKLQDEI
jgi:enoyl-CoA hydratase